MKAPNGLEIIGTLELCPGCAHVDGLRIEQGKIAFDYAGDTKMYWDDQKPVERNGETVFLDTEGNEWLESQVIAANQPTPAIPIGAIMAEANQEQQASLKRERERLQIPGGAD